MKKLLFVAIILLLLLSACSKSAVPKVEQSVSSSPATSTAITKQDYSEMKILLKINGYSFTAALENNKAAKQFFNLIKNEALTIKLSDYSGFEKVGSLGTTLTAEDKQITTREGDIVLYNSDSIVIFYGSNTWDYTMLGHIEDVSNLKTALGRTDVEVKFETVNQ